VDGDKGRESLTGLVAQYGELPARLTVRTGKGLHLYFAWPTDVSLHNSAGKIGKGLDVRGEGGYVLAPSSVHPSGAIYSVVKGDAIPPAPAWLLQMAASPNLPPPTTLPAPGARIGPGGRHKRLAHIIGRMLCDGMSQEAILAAALAENAGFSSPKAEDEVREQVADMVRRYPHTAPQDSGGFVLETLSDLMARPNLPTDWVWEGCLVAGTVSTVTAKPKVGKSTFARNLCLAVARGEPFLGMATRQGGVVYLALEERPEEIRADFEALGADGMEPIWIHAAPTPAEGMAALIDMIRERKPRLVVIDTLFRLARVRDASAYAEVSNAMEPLINIARETGTHIMVLHHASKAPKADPIDSPLGSTAISGTVSTLITLKRSENYRTIETVQRVGHWMPESVLQFDPGSRQLSLGGTREEADLHVCEERILEFMSAAEGPQTQAQIRDGVEGQTKTVRAALTELVRHGRVAKTGEGTKGKPFLYEFPNSGSQDILGTRKPESEKVPQTRINTEAILVPENSENAILVPENSEGRESEKTSLAPAAGEGADREDFYL
jgi:hypothetical protein